MRLLLLLTALLLALAPAATAATVQMRDEVEREGGRTFVYGVISVTAAGGEANALTVAPEPGGVVFHDAAAPLTGDARCASLDAHTVRCDASGLEAIAEVRADLGDGADRATALDPDRLPFLDLRGGPGDDALTARWATLHGGDGDDVLTGDAGVEVMHGDAGNDVLEGHGDGDYLHGGAGDDTLRGGDGHDSLHAGTTVDSDAAAGTDRLEGGAGHDTLDDQDGIGRPDPGPDALDGGPGDDTVHSYLLRRAPVRIDLSGATGSGEAGEDDALASIENAGGGAGDDTLIGDGGPNRLDGDRGRDLIHGAGGDDVLVSATSPREERQNAEAARYGPDRVFGDAGDDRVLTLATLESAISCGEGRDEVELQGTASDPAPSSAGPLVSRTCERLSMPNGRRGVRLAPFPSIGRDSLVFGGVSPSRCRCPHRIELQTVQRKPRRLAAAKLRSPAVRLRVGRSVARSVRRGATVRGKVTRVARNRFVWRFRAAF